MFVLKLSGIQIGLLCILYKSCKGDMLKYNFSAQNYVEINIQQINPIANWCTYKHRKKMKFYC